MKEGSGIRVPNVNSIRAHIMATFAADPNAMILRKELIRGRNDKTVDRVINLLKNQGIITREFIGTNVAYRLAGAEPLAKKTQRDRRSKAVRQWPHGSYYQPPQPVYTSVWTFAAAMGASHG